MVRLTLIARARDGLPLAEGLDADKEHEMYSYKSQAKVGGAGGSWLLHCCCCCRRRRATLELPPPATCLRPRLPLTPALPHPPSSNRASSRSWRRAASRRRA